jgi:putative transposase
VAGRRLELTRTLSLKILRKSIRLKGYDYTQPGGYFVTAVTFRRECLFGEILNEKMILNRYGKIVDECWQAIPAHFLNVELGAYVVMPNHVHGIIVICENETIPPATVGATHWVAPTKITPTHRPTGPRKGSLGAIIGAFKMAATRQIMSKLDGANIWQRGYYEHIVRDEMDANRIHAYIEANPANWAEDDENPLIGQSDILPGQQKGKRLTCHPNLPLDQILV